jgi:lipopolysaccharide biosynthesis glycosyltransferase
MANTDTSHASEHIADRSLPSLTSEIDIAFGMDGEYAPHVAAAIVSIVRQSRARFRFIVLSHNVPASCRARIELCAPGSRFLWIEVQERDIPPYLGRGHFTRAILYRLGLEQLAPEDCQRVIYLDSDIIVMTEIEKLWTQDLHGRALGAVFDSFVDSREFARRWSLREDAIGYFNSGVLLIDLEKVRSEQLFRSAIDFVVKEGRHVGFLDQDALNWVFWDNWHQLDAVWNVQRHMVISESSIPQVKRLDGRRPAIVHFTGVDKPWTIDYYHPWAWLYWQSLARTPFFDDVARKYGVTWHRRFRLWLRWLRRRPRSGLSTVMQQ